MPLVLADRVQQTGTANTTVSFTLSATVPGYQSFAVVGNGNTTYYAATDASGSWEVGLGTYSTTGPTLTRTTVYSSSNSGSAVTFSGTVTVFLTYPSSQSVYEDASGNVSPLGTIASGTWNGSTIGVAYGGTGVTASSGANSVMLRDANQNVVVNRLNQSNQTITAAAGTTVLTAASSYSQTLVGTGAQTFRMPDATTLTTGVAFVFNNNATGTLTLVDNASGALGTITSGGAAELVLLANGTVAGTWDVHGFIPENVTWGTNALALGSTVITGGTWQGGAIGTAYGGTGLSGATPFTSGGAVYANSASTLTSGTLPITAGGTGLTSTPANGALDIGNGTGFTRTTLTAGTGVSVTNGAGSITIANTGVTSVTGTSPVASSGGSTPAISLATGYGDTQNPYASKTANFFLAAPNGLAGVPTFRAIVAADIPTLNQNTTGTAANVSGTVAVANGGTGSTTSAGALTNLGAQAALVSGTNIKTINSNSILGSGNLAISASPAGADTQVQYNSAGSFAGSANLTFNGTNLTCGGTVTANSDERLKTNWRDLPPDFIEQMAKVKRGIYDRLDIEATQAGVSAQSLLKPLKEAVHVKEDGTLSVAYGNAALVLAIELAERVVALEARLAALEK